MQFCLARLKLQFTIYNITTNISVEESWKCTVWPKVFFFFFFFCLFLSLTKKEGGYVNFQTHIYITEVLQMYNFTVKRVYVH